MLIVVETLNRSYSTTSSWPKSEPGPPEAPGVLPALRRLPVLRRIRYFGWVIISFVTIRNILPEAPEAYYLPRIP